MDPAAALHLLAKHREEKARELATAPPAEKDPNEPTGQVIEICPPEAAPDAPPPPPPAAVGPGPVLGGAESLESTAGDGDAAAWSTPDLLARVRLLQRDRVATYRTFDAALDACTDDGGTVDGAAYGAVVAQITKMFDLVSRRVNAIEAALRLRTLAPAADCVRRVQAAEKEKLELTAARHLGAFRADDAASRAHVDKGLRACVARINEALDDLGCELADED